MISRPQRLSARRTLRGHARLPYSISSRVLSRRNVTTKALFSRGGGNASTDVATAVKDIGKRYSSPSEAGNEAVADLVSGLGRVNTNPRSPDFRGEWRVVYSSGNSGLTALDGRISAFRVGADGTYENECTTRTLGVIPGYAKEGGQLKVTGGRGYELVQEYREIKNGPGGVVMEGVEDPTIRAFDVLYLDSTLLITRLASTRYRDDDSGRMVTVRPEDAYFLVWQKAGAALGATGAAPASPRRAPPAKVSKDAPEEAEEGEEGPLPGLGLFKSIGTAIVGRQPGLATLAERSAAAAPGGGREAQEEDPREARRRAAEEERQRRRQEAEARRQEAAERKEAQARARSQSRAQLGEEADEDGTAVLKRGLGALFGGGGGGGADAPAPPGRAGRAPAQASRRSEAQQGREAAARARREEQEQKARAVAEERAQKQREAEERKRAEEAERKETAARKAAIQSRLDEMQSDVREAGDSVKQIQAALREAQREARDAGKAGSAARRRVEGTEATFARAEGQLDEANEAFNALAAQLREKQAEVTAAEREAERLEGALIKM